MNINPRHIGFDIDGVVADTAGAFLRIARERYGINGISIDDITHFDVARCLPIKPQIIEAIFGALLKNPIEADLQPMPHAVAVLTELSAHAPLNFITARPDKEPVADWLRHILGDPVANESTLVAMGDHDGKSDYIKRLGLRYFVDDRAQTCIDLDLAGLVPLVFSQPWNRGRHQLTCVDSWLAIRELCL